MKRNGQTRIGLGAASMVLILLVLCLALLGVLSLVTARADLRMSSRDMDLALQYARASVSVQKALADLDEKMAEAWQCSQSDAQYAAACMRIETAGDAVVLWLDDETAEIAVDAGAGRELCVLLMRNTMDEAAENRYIIKKHTLQNVGDYEQTESLMLMGM